MSLFDPEQRPDYDMEIRALVFSDMAKVCRDYGL